MTTPADDDTTYRTKVSTYYGDLVGLGEDRPDNGLLDALDVPGGLADWVQSHPPAPEVG